MGSAPAIAYLTALDADVHDRCDRVVFEFRDPLTPSVSAAYRSGPFTLSPSDQPVTIAGSAFLVLRFDRTSGVDLGAADPRPTYTGPRSLVPTGLQHIRELRNTEDFEAVMQWVIGLDDQRPFTVTYLQSPPSVVVAFS
jgi:hypothetical protein